VRGKLCGLKDISILPPLDWNVLNKHLPSTLYHIISFQFIIHFHAIMQQEQPGSAVTTEVDLAQHPNARKLVQRCQDFFAEVENL
jgi:hypothetical protein